MYERAKEMNMKRIAYLVLVALLSLLTACSGKASQGQTETSSEPQSQQATESPSMNIEEIAEGNYSSVAGIWVSASGERLVFNAQGLVTTEYSPEPASLTYFGTANMVVNRGAQDLREGFTLEFIPAGVTIEEQTDYNGNVLFTDNSDSSRDRLWTGSIGSAYQEQGNFFYRLQ